MKTHKHLFDRVCALENILAASREALCHGKRAKPPGARYCAELEKDAVRLLAELLGGTYRHGAYTYFPDGQIRRRGTNRRRPCQAQGLPARPACRFSKCGSQRTGGPATASSAAKDVAGSFFVADFAFHHPAPSLMFSALAPTFTLDTPSPPSDISRP